MPRPAIWGRGENERGEPVAEEIGRAFTPRDTPHAVVLAGLAGAALTYQFVLRGWYVEDAAISFAYARNFAEGQGLVPYLGGERVEGYSNPLWVLLLAGAELLGVDGFASSKFLAAALLVATLQLVYAVTREAVGERLPHAPLLAATLYVLNAQAMVWTASGLENPLFSALLAAGAWVLAVEGRTRHRWPLSAAVFLALALTRPEGAAYAGVAFLFAAGFAWQAGRGRSVALRWLLVFAVPFGAAEVARLWYFAWPQPNTAYAKLGSGAARRLVNWDGDGWTYVREFGRTFMKASLAPLYLLGLFGERAIVASLVAGGVFAALLLTNGHTLGGVRAGVLLLSAAAIPLIGARRPLAALAAFAACAAGFAILAGGDWTRNYRWFATFAVPGSVLLAVGGCELLAAVAAFATRRTPSLVGGIRLVALALLPAFAGLVSRPDVAMMFEWPTLTRVTPFMVQSRLRMLQELAARVGFEERVSLLTVDQGGFAWWSGFEMLDKGALIDVSTAHNHGMAFHRQYILEDRRPLFLSGHQFIPDWMKDDAFRQAYIPFRHRNEWYAIRRDQVFSPEWAGEHQDRKVVLGGGITLEGWEVASPEVAGRVALTLGLRVVPNRHLPKVIRLDLTNPGGGVVASYELEAGYGIVPAKDWQGEVFVGHATLALDGLAPGALGLAVSVRTGLGTEFDGEPDHAWFPGAIEIVTPAEATAAAEADRTRSVELAAQGACSEAERAWSDARAHLLDQPEWAHAKAPELSDTLAACWVGRGADTDLKRALALAPQSPGVVAACRAGADAAELRGAAAWENQRWWDAFEAYNLAVRLEPTRAWARRWAEEARGLALRQRKAP